VQFTVSQSTLQPCDRKGQRAQARAGPSVLGEAGCYNPASLMSMQTAQTTMANEMTAPIMMTASTGVPPPPPRAVSSIGHASVVASHVQSDNYGASEQKFHTMQGSLAGQKVPRYGNGIE
jgi:hypothetical protein